MNTGLTLVIPNADFSANSVGNSIFPSYANLKQALFYGNAIPDLSALKKAKGVNESTLGTAVTQEYDIKLANGDSFPNVIDKLPNNQCSIAMVLTRGAGAAVPGAYRVAKSGVVTSAANGDITFNFWDNGTTAMQLQLSNVNAASSRVSLPDYYPYFIVIGTFNSVSREVTLTVANDAGIETSTQIATGLQPNGSLYNTDAPFGFAPLIGGGMHYSSVAIFDKALNSTEVQELVNYYKEFYKDAPSPY